MRTFLFFALGFANLATGYSQGTILFANGSAAIGVNQFITDMSGTRLSGTGFFVELYSVSPTLELTPIGEPINFKTGGKAGLFSDPVPRVIPNAPPGTSIMVEVRAWDSTLPLGRMPRPAVSNSDPRRRLPSPLAQLMPPDFCLVFKRSR